MQRPQLVAQEALDALHQAGILGGATLLQHGSAAEIHADRRLPLQIMSQIDSISVGGGVAVRSTPREGLMEDVGRVESYLQDMDSVASVRLLDSDLEVELMDPPGRFVPDGSDGSAVVENPIWTMGLVPSHQGSTEARFQYLSRIEL